MWKIVYLGGDGVDVEAYRSRNVAQLVLYFRVPAHGRQKPCRIDDFDVFVVEVFGQPLGFNKGLRVFIGHKKSPRMRPAGPELYKDSLNYGGAPSQASPGPGDLSP